MAAAERAQLGGASRRIIHTGNTSLSLIGLAPADDQPIAWVAPQLVFDRDQNDGVHRFALAVGSLLAVAGFSGPADRSPGDIVAVMGTDVFVAERGAESSEGRPDLLFLHGASFTAEVWIETGILDATAEAGFRAVAVDLPGQGNTTSIQSDRGDFLGALIGEVDSGNGAVVVSPSMSGGWSWTSLRPMDRRRCEASFQSRQLALTTSQSPSRNP